MNQLNNADGNNLPPINERVVSAKSSTAQPVKDQVQGGDVGIPRQVIDELEPGLTMIFASFLMNTRMKSQ